MAETKGTVFLERRSYRQRRLADLARALPVVGLLLMLIPLLWTQGAEDGTRTSRAIYWIFGVWAVLVCASGLLARGAERDEAAGPQPTRRESGGPPGRPGP
ncbi:hypothetical protein [Pseudooceanicola pacificus]|uniref:hypothetical protein n=1 Tax=Pseudooceanicola pacificus TaxID=2676438 RepID=UPI001920EBAB|nr:hypothetical protein [Pseudooceanicola pacificus]